ncbi:MAG: choice-of-anchor B family protein [Phycisphaerae bacterium]
MQTRVTLAGSALALLLAGQVLGHVDDPKLRDRQPPYRGPGYRAALRDTPPAFPASGITLMSWLPLAEFGTQHVNGNSCTGYVSPSGREYAIMGLSHGTGFVEITDPGNAQIVTVKVGPTSLWRDMKTYGNYCYCISEGGGGIQVFDISQIDAGVITQLGSVTTGGATATHTLALNAASGYLYRCGGSGNGLRIYSLTNPASPTFVASWVSRYVHEAQIVSYTSGPYAGKEIAFCCGGTNNGFNNTGLYILDVTNKAAITQLGFVTWPNAGYSHQIWLSDDRRYAYVNDELDEETFGLTMRTLIIDVQNLSTPTLTSTFSNGNTSIDHNLYVKGNLIFESNYRSGLHVIDATNPTAPVEIANFDTWPPDDFAYYNSLWNNYPFYPSGTIIGSDIEKGLFVWRLSSSGINFTYPAGRPSAINPAGQTLDVNVNLAGATQIQPGSEKLFYKQGAGFVSSPLTPISGNLYRANLPATTCGTTLRYYVEARSTDGVTWRDPASAPSSPNEALAAYGTSVAHSDDLETGSGWTVGATGDSGSTWVLGDPPGSLIEPSSDHTPGSGVNCFYTGNGIDVTGRTTLTTPALDLSASPDARLSYWRWFANAGNVYSINDVFVVDISNDNGTNWTRVETIGTSFDSSGGWLNHEFRVADFVPPTAQVRLRFIASDPGNGSETEAAIDDLSVIVPNCSAPCPGDLTGDRHVDESDLGLLLSAWQTSAAGDLDGDGDTDESDLGVLLANFGNVCP